GVVVVAIGGEVVAVERDEGRLILVKHAVDADLVAGDLDVAHVADLPERREALTGNALPRRRHPRPPFARHEAEGGFETVRGGGEILDRGRCERHGAEFIVSLVAVRWSLRRASEADT